MRKNNIFANITMLALPALFLFCENSRISDLDLFVDYFRKWRVNALDADRKETAYYNVVVDCGESTMKVTDL